ncbi:MAG: hypothetical protein KDC05_11690, partial [Bacteroidales bacterium]|nr:hypothetical protein [Bacteroidales bacterium]
MNTIKTLLLFVALSLILQLSAEDYYWVGGSGKWSDLNSWRTATGEIPNEIPDEADNVIFNENSFLNNRDTVFILTGNPTCHDMRWMNLSDTVVMYGGSGSTAFTITGSVTLHYLMYNFYQGTIYFTSFDQETISSDTCWFHGSIVFDGPGNWTLADNLYVGINPRKVDTEPNVDDEIIAKIIQNDGTFNSDGQSIYCEGFRSEAGNPRNLFIKNSYIISYAEWYVNGQQFTMNADSSEIWVASQMSNNKGNDLVYNDVYFFGIASTLKNDDIHSYHRLIYFLGAGSVIGKFDAGDEGRVTADTLLFNGFVDPMSLMPIECTVKGPEFDIHYTAVSLDSLSHGRIDCKDSYFHRIDYFGPDYEEWYGLQFYSAFSGVNNVADTIQFLNQNATFNGSNTITSFLYFKEDATISGFYNGSNLETNIYKARLRSDGYFNGNNIIENLQLNTGYWYRVGSDSLETGNPTFTYRLKVENIEVTGECEGGITRLTSAHKEYYAILEYAGDELGTEYLFVKDLINTGNLLNIDQGINGGNVFGFVFSNEQTERNLYWVGGMGNWTDKTHWSLVPGVYPGDQCPPTIRDNVFFNTLSGFQAGDTVFLDRKHIGFNDMFWDIIPGRPLLLGADTSIMHIWGSIKLDKTMTFAFTGDVYFESENDEFYETIDLRNKINKDGVNVDMAHLFGKVFFYGKGGKWTLGDSKLIALNDTTFLSEGELLLETDTMHLFNFQSTDTLTKGLYMMGKSLVSVHQGGEIDAWNFESYKVDEKTFFDAGRSTIISLGNLATAVPGTCHIRSFGWMGELDSLKYHNIQFGAESFNMPPYLPEPAPFGPPLQLIPDNVLTGLVAGPGIGSKLKSVTDNGFHLVDYYVAMGGTETGTRGTIDTLTTKENLGLFCSFLGNYNINFYIAEADNDSLLKSHHIDTVLLKGRDQVVDGFHFIGYLQANRYVDINGINSIDTGVFYGNASFKGQNIFSQKILSPNKRYTYAKYTDADTNLTIINDDFIVMGDCDAPIRLNSDSIGTAAHILYKALNSTDQFAGYASFRDIYMEPYGNNTYEVFSSVDLGNNTNLTFNNTNNDTYYWVGGGGNWGDWWHWSNTSGGPPIPERCVPREINTVIFDTLSFTSPTDSVYIEVLNAYCKNMIWINDSLDFSTRLMGADTSVLYVYGSLLLSDTGSMSWQFTGDLLFDQFEEANDTADIIHSKGNVITSNIRLQGLNDTIKLWDDLNIFYDTLAFPDPIFTYLYHENGTFDLNGKHLNTGGYISNYKSPRTLILDNSRVTAVSPTEKRGGILKRAFWLNGTNLTLSAENSLITKGWVEGAIYSEYGDVLNFNNIQFKGTASDSLFNRFNTANYNLVKSSTFGTQISKEGSQLSHFTADTVILNSNNSGIYQESDINVVILNGNICEVAGTHDIKRCFVNQTGFIRGIEGSNEIEYCVFKASGYFYGNNIFDTLIMYPGAGDFNLLGNKFRLEAGKTQYVMDSLNLRGNQCSNITISSLSPPNLAYLEVVNGAVSPDVICDYLYINSVEAISDVVTFYAGINSTPQPNPNNPPPGWIFDNAQGYIFGLNGATDQFCYGDEYVIQTTNFNGSPSTLYFWEGSSVPGGNTYTVTEPGTYHVRVEYFEGCYVDDYIKLEANLPPDAWIEPGPYCEGDLIRLNTNPGGGDYKYLWFDGQSTRSIRATLDMNDGGIFAKVTDQAINCSTKSEQMVVVKPTPDPEPYLGDDVWIKYGETVDINAGPGDTYVWASDPPRDFAGGNNQEITVEGYLTPTEYQVTVTLDGCDSTGYKIV